MLNSKKKIKIIIIISLIISIVLFVLTVIDSINLYNLRNEMLNTSKELTTLDKRDYPKVLRENLNENLGIRDLLQKNVSELQYKAAFFDLKNDIYFKIFENNDESSYFIDESVFPKAEIDSNIIVNLDSNKFESKLNKLKVGDLVYLQVSKDRVLEFRFKEKVILNKEKNIFDYVHHIGKELLTIKVGKGAFVFSLDRLPSIYDFQGLLFDRLSFFKVISYSKISLGGFFILLSLISCILDRKDRKFRKNSQFRN